MAIEQRNLDVNSIDWTTRDTSWVPADGEKWYFHNHPDYTGIVYLYGNGTNTTAALNIHADTWQGGMYLTDTRSSNKEVVSGSIGTGWVTIAETEQVSLPSISGEIVVTSASGAEIMGVKYAICPGTAANYRRSTFDYSLLGPLSDTFTYITRMRLLTGAATGGAKIQVYVNTATSGLTVQLKGNTSRVETYEGLMLVDPYVDALSNLPDGTSPTTTIYAGVRFSQDNPASYPASGTVAVKTSDDSIRVSILWPNMPWLNATGVTINLPSGALYFYDGVGNSSASLTTATVSSFEVVEDTVYFVLSQTSAFAGIANNSVGTLYFQGSGGYYELT